VHLHKIGPQGLGSRPGPRPGPCSPDPNPGCRQASLLLPPFWPPTLSHSDPRLNIPPSPPRPGSPSLVRIKAHPSRRAPDNAPRRHMHMISCRRWHRERPKPLHRHIFLTHPLPGAVRTFPPQPDRQNSGASLPPTAPLVGCPPTSLPRSSSSLSPHSAAVNLPDSIIGIRIHLITREDNLAQPPPHLPASTTMAPSLAALLLHNVGSPSFIQLSKSLSELKPGHAHAHARAHDPRPASEPLHPHARRPNFSHSRDRRTPLWSSGG
jgi:hypothetical protein